MSDDLIGVCIVRQSKAPRKLSEQALNEVALIVADIGAFAALPRDGQDVVLDTDVDLVLVWVKSALGAKLGGTACLPNLIDTRDVCMKHVAFVCFAQVNAWGKLAAAEENRGDLAPGVRGCGHGIQLVAEALQIAVDGMEADEGHLV
ncbi:hypothetical protein HDU83_001766 [Entophlyctis luteolus]|nr:hypothetical protein HDU83_001766 [Entophlyctis luteolus]